MTATGKSTEELLTPYSYTLPVSSLKEYEKWFKEAREIRRKSADWDFINRQPEPIRSALIVLVETGDLWVAAKIAGMKLDDFNELRLKAKIPIVI